MIFANSFPVPFIGGSFSGILNYVKCFGTPIYYLLIPLLPSCVFISLSSRSLIFFAAMFIAFLGMSSLLIVYNTVFVLNLCNSVAFLLLYHPILSSYFSECMFSLTWFIAQSPSEEFCFVLWIMFSLRAGVLSLLCTPGSFLLRVDQFCLFLFGSVALARLDVCCSFVPVSCSIQTFSLVWSGVHGFSLTPFPWTLAHFPTELRFENLVLNSTHFPVDLREGRPWERCTASVWIRISGFSSLLWNSIGVLNCLNPSLQSGLISTLKGNTGIFFFFPTIIWHILIMSSLPGIILIQALGISEREIPFLLSFYSLWYLDWYNVLSKINCPLLPNSHSSARQSKKEK